MGKVQVIEFYFQIKFFNRFSSLSFSETWFSLVETYRSYFLYTCQKLFLNVNIYMCTIKADQGWLFWIAHSVTRNQNHTVSRDKIAFICDLLMRIRNKHTQSWLLEKKGHTLLNLKIGTFLVYFWKLKCLQKSDFKFLFIEVLKNGQLINLNLLSHASSNHREGLWLHSLPSRRS